ncbi:helix-turn-helix transcriptional regulator [Streptomyces sp. NPDC048361]|uniref:helix-turn-helix domain-containing protein n=1 Tax=Streptomyces sp. NPDC048361 TaxID=3154720 RepID=UPI00341D4510
MKMLEQPAFGRRLRQLRQQRGLTQASLTGPRMSAAYVSRLEAGSRPPTAQSVELLAAKLNVPASVFNETEVTALSDTLATTAALWESATKGELRHQLEQALEKDTDADPTLQLQAYAQLAKLQGEEGHSLEEYDTLQHLMRVSEELGHPVLLLNAHLRLARCQRALGHVDDARATARAGLHLVQQAGLGTDDAIRLKILLVSTAAELGDLADAKRLSAEICAPLENRRGSLTAEAWWTAATVTTRIGDHNRARLLLDKALAAVSSREDLSLWVRLRLAAAALTLQAAPPRLDAVEHYLAEVKPALDLVGTAPNQQEHTFLTAQLSYARGDFAAARALCDGIEQDALLLSYRDRIRFQMLRAQIRIAEGDTTAITDLTALAERAQDTGMIDLATEVWRTAAQAHTGRKAHEGPGTGPEPEERSSAPSPWKGAEAPPDDSRTGPEPRRSEPGEQGSDLRLLDLQHPVSESPGATAAGTGMPSVT